MNTLSVAATPKAIRKQKFLTYYARTTQFLMWPFVWVFSVFFFKISISGKENLSKVHSPFIIVSNHIAYFDCFLFRIIFGGLSQHLPLRFMAVKKFSSHVLNFFSAIGVVDLVYAFFGVFTIVKGQGVDKNLETAVEIIESGGNVVIYPEGHVTRTKGSIDPFRHGAAVLARKTSTPILPISFRFGKTGFVKKELFISIGSPLMLSTTHLEDENTAQIFNAVSSLYHSS